MPAPGCPETPEPKKFFTMSLSASVAPGSTVMLVVGTSGAVYPAANFVRWVGPHVRKIYIGPEEPMNAHAFTDIVLGNAGQVLPELIEVR